MKKTVLISALIAPFAVLAAPSSQVAWTAEQLNFVKSGNPQKGKELSQTCASCHGANGISTMPSFPSLAGQQATYLFKQLHDYKDGSRDNPMMTGVAKSLSSQDMADLAAWFASQPRASLSSTQLAYDKADQLVKKGSSERLLPPCEVCHGSNGLGQKMDIPALAGQSAEYISTTLKAFKNGSRHNDIYSRMRLIAQPLPDEEITELGLYYQNIKQ